MNNIPPLTGQQSFIGKYGSALIWYGAWLSMPSPKARGHYIKATLWTLAGAFLLFATMAPHDQGSTTRLTPPQTPYFERFDWRWPLLCWAVAVLQLVLCIREGRRAKRAHAQWKAEQYAAHAAVEQYAEVAWEQDVLDIEKPAPAPPPEPTPVVVVPEPVDRPELIIPSFPGSDSRVRRGGTTRSGVPIKDRRSRDPRTIL